MDILKMCMALFTDDETVKFVLCYWFSLLRELARALLP